MSKFAQPILGLVVFIFGASWFAFARELLKSYVYDRILHMLNPYLTPDWIERLFLSIPALGMLMLGLFLFRATLRQELGGLRRNVLGDLAPWILIVGGPIIGITWLLVRSPDFAKGEQVAEHVARVASSDRQKPEDTTHPPSKVKPDAQLHHYPETAQLSLPAKGEPPSRQLYYTRPEIDSMLATLGELQRFFKSKPAPSDAIGKLIARMTGQFVPPEMADFPVVADGLEKYADQIWIEAGALESILKNADEFVKSSVTEPIRSNYLPLYETLRRTAEILRHVAQGTNDRGVAGRAIRAEQAQALDVFVKYSSWVQSSQTKVAEKIADLRGRDVQ
jgi:hypothetical protein